MRIIITENQYGRLFEQEEISCVPTAKTQFNTVKISFYDLIKGGDELQYGDCDKDETHPIWGIQKKLGIYTDGCYGKDMLEALILKIDNFCDDKEEGFPIDGEKLKQLELYIDISTDNENHILASTLVGENQTADEKELNAILSTIYNRAVKCGYTMKDSVLKGKQYSTWNYYNNLITDEEKYEELYNRVHNQIPKGFKRMLGVVNGFSDTDVIKVNHYVNPNKVDLSTASTRTIALSYNKNKSSSQQIGDHMFWWDKMKKDGKYDRGYHPC